MKSASEPSVWPFVLPLAVFLVVGMFEPRFGPTVGQPGETADAQAGAGSDSVDPDREANRQYVEQQQRRKATTYCIIYFLRVAVTCGLLAGFAGVYVRQFPLSVTFWSVVAGIAGVVLWVALCELNVEERIIAWLNAEAITARASFNPFDGLPAGWQQVAFLGLRFFGLVVVVPLCEEIFLRGLLMRYVESPDWWTVSLGRLGLRASLVAPLYGALTHPGELIAAVAWFSLVTWLVSRTGKFWDAVVAHATTNLLLGLYVCAFSQWHLW